jgi:hypothetical protein
MIDEMELVERFGEVDPLPIEALDRAEAVLRAAMTETLPPVLSPVTGRGHRRRPNRRSLASIAAVAAAVACAAGGLVIAGSGSTGSPTTQARGSGGPGHAVPAVLTAFRVRLIASHTTALADSGSAVETLMNTSNGSPQAVVPTTIDVTFSGQNVNYAIGGNGSDAKGVQDRVVDGQVYTYIEGPDLQMHWYHQTQQGAEAGMSFVDPRTLLRAVSPSAGLENLGQESVGGVELTHLRATTPGAIGQMGIPDVTGTVKSFDVWVDGNNVVHQMRISSTSGNILCSRSTPGVSPHTHEDDGRVTILPGGKLVPTGVTCTYATATTTEVSFSDLGAPESVAVPSGAIDQQAEG